MTRRTFTWAVAALAAAIPLYGFIRETTSSGTPLFRRDSASVQAYINTGITAGAHNGSGKLIVTVTSNPVAAISAAASSWSSIPTSTLRFAVPQPTSLSNNPSDGKFVLTMQDSAANRSVLGDALAVTLFQYLNDGTITDSDILFNPNNTDPSTGVIIPWSTDGEPNTYDLQSVATHEMGHSIGAEHSPVLSATMFQATSPISAYAPVAAATLQSRLSPDDIALATEVYPAASAPQQYGSITGRVFQASNNAPILGALIGAVNTSTGTVIGGLASLTNGTYSLNRVPAGTYLVYAYPANGPVTAGNFGLPNISSLNSNFRSTFAGGNGSPLSIVVAPGGTAAADVSVDSATPGMHIAYMGTGSAGGLDWTISGAAQVTPSGSSTDILLWGSGLANGSTPSISESQISLLGPGLRLRAGSLRVQSGSTFGGFTPIRFTVDSAVLSTTAAATVAVINGSDAAIYSGGLVILGNGTTAPTCTASLNTNTVNFAAAGGTGSVTLTQPAGCSGTVTSNANWISVTSGTTAAAASSNIAFTVAANSSSQSRTGTLTIAGLTFTITQAGSTVVTPSGAPTVVSLSPSATTGQQQTFAFIFSDPNGYTALDIENVLINTALSSPQACYLAYQRSSSYLFLVPNNGDATQITGASLGSSGTLSNSQCSVSLTGSSASGSLNNLTLTLAITFNSSFSGNKVIYAAARDTSGNNSGWQTIGVHQVPGAAVTYPLPAGMTPASGSGLAQTFTFSFQDQSSATNLQTAWMLIRDSIDSRNACFVSYYRPANLVFLYPDNGDGTQAISMPLSGTGTLSNGQCTVSAQGASAQASGSTLTITLPITFTTSFAGNKGIWQAVLTMPDAQNHTQVSDWLAVGAWQAPAQ